MSHAFFDGGGADSLAQTGSFSLAGPRGVALDTLFAGATRTGVGSVHATSCTTDWRQVEPGDVYVALPDMADSDHSEDGHQHAARAVSHGAVAVVCEQPVPVFDVPTYLVEDSRIALGQLSQALMGNPSHTLPVIGVSGTHGKSTTIAVLESIFSQAGKHCGKISSLGTYDGMAYGRGIGPAPSSPALAERLAKMVAAGCTHALLEVSDRSLSQQRLAGLQLDSVCLTHVTDAHLNWHNSIQAYRDTERRVFDYLAPTGISVLNADDPVSMQWLDCVEGPLLTYGRGSQAEISARLIEQHANGQLFLLTAGSDSALVRTTIVGEHHVANCLAATALSLAYGIDLPTIAAGIEAVVRLPSRMERIDCGQGFPVYVDAAHTPQALGTCLRAARQLSTGRVICVLGDNAHRAAGTQYAALSQVVRRLADLVIVSKKLPAVAATAPPAHVELVANREEAIACAVAMAQAGDVVVIAGSGPRSGAAVGEKNKDLEITRQLLFSRSEEIHLAA